MSDRSGSLVAGKFRLLRRLASGGMGEVYVARNEKNDRLRALKLLHASAGLDAAALRLFRREATIVAKIMLPSGRLHPGVVEVFDADLDADGTPYIEMELLEGESLTHAAARGDLTVRAWTEIVRAALEPLAIAHAQGIVHRDLKPDNVFLTKGEAGPGRVRLLDFGIARQRDAQASTLQRTADNVFMGTLHYISPEQAKSARSVLPPADVWSVGVMLYQAATGAFPYEGETALEVLSAILATEHAPVATRAPWLPTAFAALIDRCLLREPTARPRDGGTLAKELDAILADPAVRATVGAHAVHLPSAVRDAVASAEATAHTVSDPTPSFVTGETVPAVSSAVAVSVTRPPSQLLPRTRWLARAGIMLLAAAAVASLGIGGWLFASHPFRSSRPTPPRRPAAPGFISEIRSTIGRRHDEVRACLETAARATRFSGRTHARVSLAILSSGDVTRVQVRSDDLADPTLTSCIAGVMTSLRFAPDPSRDDLTINYPFELVIPPAEPAAELPVAGETARDRGLALVRAAVPVAHCAFGNDPSLEPRRRGNCRELRGPIPASMRERPRAECLAHHGSWSNGPCPLAGTIGGCADLLEPVLHVARTAHVTWHVGSAALCSSAALQRACEAEGALFVEAPGGPVDRCARDAGTPLRTGQPLRSSAP